MIKEKAEQIAQDRANKTNKTYCIVQVRNGQWIVESLFYLTENPVGRMIYGGKKQIDFKPQSFYISPSVDGY